MNDDERRGRGAGVGDPAPDFTLNTHNEGELNLAWYRGRKNVVLAFYPGDWTPVCATQVPEYQKLADKFAQYDCQLLCVSVDSVPCHIAWARSLGGLDFPLMSDYFPHGEAARKYGVFHKKGFAERAVFLIDKAGIIRYVEHIDLMKLPDNDELFRQLALLEGKPSATEE
ncbi:MAG: redoxin domain-containing protein [candidate division Zixibacteria bacterium]|nr:redoxin domain-containing protein [candidate division Zixibacteria bacterium]